MQYNAIGEVDIAPTPARAAKMLDALAEYHPVVGATADGRTEVIITIDTNHLAAAGHHALYVMQDALGQLRSFTIMSTEEFDRRTDSIDADDEMMSTAQAAETLGVSRQRIVQLIEASRLAGVRKVGRGYAIPWKALQAYRDEIIASARAEVAKSKATKV